MLCQPLPVTKLLAMMIIKAENTHGINILNKEFTANQFADDTTIFLKNASRVHRLITVQSLRPTPESEGEV